MRHRMLVALTGLGLSLTLAVGACAPVAETGGSPSAGSGASPSAGSGGSPSAGSGGSPSAGSGGSPSAGPAEPVELAIWSWRSDLTDQANEVFDVYEAEHPGVTVDFVGYDGTKYDSILQTGLAGADGPDIAMHRPYGATWPLIEGGSFVAVDDLVPALAEYPEGGVIEGERGPDGKLYGVPSSVQVIGLYYNKGIFESQGIEVPTTWDEFTAACDKLLEAGVIPLAVQTQDNWLLPFYRDIFGAPLYGGFDFATKVKSGETDFTDPSYVAANQLLLDLEKYYPEDFAGLAYTGAQTLFASGRAAMYPSGSWETTTFAETPDLDLGWFSPPPPPGSVTDGLTPSYADGGFALSAETAHKDAAVELLNWIATPEFAELAREKLGWVGGHLDVLPTDPLLKQQVEASQDHPAPMLSLEFSGGSPTANSIESSELQKMLLGEATAEQVAEAVQTGVSQWFKAP